MKRIEDKLNKHRSEAYYICSEDCWCWDVEALLSDIERLKAEYKEDVQFANHSIEVLTAEIDRLKKV